MHYGSQCTVLLKKLSIERCYFPPIGNIVLTRYSIKRGSSNQSACFNIYYFYSISIQESVTLHFETLFAWGRIGTTRPLGKEYNLAGVMKKTFGYYLVQLHIYQ